MTDFRADLLARFRWIDGHADVLGLFGDARLLSRAGDALAAPFASAGVTKIAAVEARGFVLGTAAALAAGVGLVPIRKAGAIHPGPKARRRSAPDWRGNEPTLELQRAAVGRGDRVLLVDDWAERGSQALAARALLEECGATWVGLSVLVEQLTEDVRRRLEPVVAVVARAELPGEGRS
ncbi:MAG: phosphoribosyltransferase family protein [Gaiellaceae bacterium]